MLEIYTIGGGDWLREVLNAIALFMRSNMFDTLNGIFVLFSIYVVSQNWLVNHNIMSMVTWAFVLVFVTLLITIKHSVQIIDNTNLREVYTVPNVPVGLLLPAGLSSTIGQGLVKGYESILAQPDDTTYSKTGLLFGASMVAKSTDFLSQNPEITNLFSDYVQNCVVGDILLNHKYSLEQLMNTNDPYSLIFSNPSPLRGVFDDQGRFHTCVEVAINLKNKLALDTKIGGKTWHYYARQFFGGRPDPDLLFGSLLGKSYNTFYQSGQSASEILKQNVTMNALRDGILSYSTRNGDTAGMINITSTIALEKQRLAHSSASRIATHFLPTMHVILMGIMIGIFPLIVLCGLFNAISIQVFKNYILSFLWLQCWPLLFAILNSAMTFYAKKNGAEVVLSNLSAIKTNYSDIATTAGYLSMLIPFISWGLVMGMGRVFSSVSSSLGSSMLGSTAQVASSTVDGNYSYNNMQTDNVQGFGWNTNSTFATGQMSHQTASGASATQTKDGSIVYNTSSAMSVLPNQLSIQRSISAAQQQMARESEAQAQTSLSGYNNSINSATTQLEQFTSQSGQSSTYTQGADNSTASNQSNAAHKMASAVESYAKAHNISKTQATQEIMDRAMRNTLSAGASVAGKWSSGDQLVGKLGKWATGASVEAKAHTGYDFSGSNGTSHNASDASASHTDNRSDLSAQAVSDFKEGLDILSSHRVNDSASQTENNSDSKVSQLAATFSEAKSQYQQYTDSTTRSKEYSDMASRTESLSGQMSENLTQQFANYVSRMSPHNAEEILTNTSSPEIAAQREQLAKDFVRQEISPKIDSEYSSNKNAIHSSNVASNDTGTSKNLKSDFTLNKNAIEQKEKNAGINHNVKEKVSNAIDVNQQEIANKQSNIDTQRKAISTQKEDLKQSFTKENAIQQKKYAQERVDQQYFVATEDKQNLQRANKEYDEAIEKLNNQKDKK